MPEAAGVREEVAPVADEASGGYGELEAHDAGAGVVHGGHLALALGELLDDDALVLVGHVDDQLLHRLQHMPSVVASG